MFDFYRLKKRLGEGLRPIGTAVPVIILGFIGLFFTIMIWLLFKPYTLPSDMLDLNGPWKIVLTDDPSFKNPDLNDRNWDTIRLPGNIMKYSRDKKAGMKGVCWLRKEFTLPPDVKELGLNLGKIAVADQVFFNGYKIGETGEFPPRPFAAWNHPRAYRVPDSVPYERNNVIAVRLHYNVFGDVSGNLYGLFIRSADDLKLWKRIVNKNNFIHIYIGYLAIAVGGVLCIIFGLIYYQKQTFQENLYYVLQLTAGLPIVLEVCSYWNIYYTQEFRIRLLGVAWVALNVFHPIFLHRIYRMERKRIEQCLWWYLAAVITINTFFVNAGNILFWGCILIAVTWCIGIYNIVCHLTALMNKAPYSKLFAFFGITVVACAMNDGIIYFEKMTGFTVWIPHL